MAVRPLRAGELRNRVTIQARVPTRGAQGSTSYAWADIRTVWAKIEPKSGKETFFADAIRAEASHFITMRAQPETISPEMRLLFGTRVFKILASLRVQEIQHELQIAVSENVASGVLVVVNDDGDVVLNDAGVAVFVSQ